MIRKTSFINEVWHTPVLPPIASKVEGAQSSSICLSEREKKEWQFLFEEIRDVPSPFTENQDYDFTAIDEERWEEVIVPSSLIMQGYDIKNNVEYYYRRKIVIPKDYAQNRVFIRFEGVYSNARVWVNNQYIKTHVGGFTTWDCEITKFAHEEEITLIVGVADIEGDQVGIWNEEGVILSDSSWASFYAHHNIGGILRDVTLYTLPQSYIARTHIHTVLDEAYENAILTTEMQLHGHCESMQIKTQLFDEHNQLIVSEINPIDHQYLDTWTFPKEQLTMNPDEVWKAKKQEGYDNDKKFEKRYIQSYSDRLSECGAYSVHIEMDVRGPKLWDAEHPNLYQMSVSLWIDGKMIQENTHKVGFRELSYGGMRDTDSNKIYVNGREIKLRGVCRHDVSHLYGRSITKEDIRNEILAYKRNNINHIRTSHYPASQYFLEICDELGIYVEQENSACFKGANGCEIYCAPQEFVDSFAEMIESSRNHPSIIIWSLANESGFERTYAFRTEYDYVKVADPTRPVIFSYPITVNSEPVPYDIYSQHYAEVVGSLGNDKMPVLHDEFAHVSCYNLDDLIHDNSCREVWGESIKKGWENIFKTDGALGCAIWGGIDEVFYLPEGTSESHQHHSKGRAAGYGEWGAVLDTYKREKPEAYLTKKAFSPIRLNEEKSSFGKDITLYLSNWFDHAFLTEVRMLCTDEKGIVLYNDFIKEEIAPHQDGIVTLLDANVEGSKMNLKFYYADILIDEYNLNSPRRMRNTTEISLQESFETIENNNEIILTTPSVRLHINKNTGKVFIYRANKEGCIANGPYLYGNEQELEIVQTQDVKYQIENGLAIITTHESYVNQLETQIKIVFDGKTIHTFMLPIGEGSLLDQVGQLGVKYTLMSGIESIDWHRTGLYSVYPENHIGRNEGTAYLRRENASAIVDEYGIKPEWNWAYDMADYFLFKDEEHKNHIVTNDFRTKRNNILDYTIHFTDSSRLCVTPISDGIGAFTEYESDGEKEAAQLQLTFGAYYPGLGWGNYCGEQTKLQNKGEIYFQLAVCHE